MIKLGSKEITPQGFSKVMKGSSLVWENFKNFKNLSINGYEKITINDDGAYNLPLNTPLKILSNYYNYKFVIEKDGKEAIIRWGVTFEITSKGAFTLYQEGFWSINIVKSSDNPTVFI